MAPDPAYAPGASAPVLWMGRRPEPDARSLWGALAAHFADAGLWPLMLGRLDAAGERPWSDGELDSASASDPGDLDAASVLAEGWSDATEVVEGYPPPEVAPFGAEFPGLAPASDVPEDPSAIEEALDAVGPDVALGLVPVLRPADALAAIGWQGAVNAVDDPGRLSAVLRSWEDRYGAVLVGVGFDTLTLAVTRPVRPMRIARVLAAEQYALCPDLVDQGTQTLERLAQELQHARVWQLEWD